MTISGLKTNFILSRLLRETFIKGYIVERTSKAEIRLEEQSGKVESSGENLWGKM